MSTNTGPRLNVPKIMEITDKTPTPTKLLQAVDEIGLFQDEDEDEEHRQKNVELLKDRLVGNPFDEHFRKATQMQKVLASGNEQSEKKDEVLNTPQILTSEYPTPSVLLTAEVLATKNFMTSRSNSLLGNRSARPIAPAPASTVTASNVIQQAQLLLRLPGGETMELSNLPFVKSPTKNESPKKRHRQEEVQKSAKKSKVTAAEETEEQKREQLLERNRAAAIRSRARKRVQVQKTQEQNSKLASINKALVQENTLLKEELSRLKETILLHRNCFLHQQPDQKHQHGFQILQQTPTRSPQIKIIPFDPKEILRAHNSLQRYPQTQNRLTLDNKQAFMIRPADIVIQASEQRDILKEATEQIHDDHQEPGLSLGGVVISHGFQRAGLAIGSGLQHQQQPSEVVLSSPGFVRVTPNCISVKSPIGKEKTLKVER